jgi:predicted Rossmann fold nucleotide-binding protein DprA/Smf involved in DNA uptake
MKVGVVGNRDGWEFWDVERILLKELKPEDEIVSGGAEGVDEFAYFFAKNHNHKITIFEPIFGKPSPERYFERNRKIVDYCDRLIAFNKKTRSGTTFTINRAKKSGKDVKVFSTS